jgi:hypothetical protein
LFFGAEFSYLNIQIKKIHLRVKAVVKNCRLENIDAESFLG